MRECVPDPDKHGFMAEGVSYSFGEVAGPFYLNTRFESLVGTSPTSPGSRGIFVEGGLRNGVCTHQSLKGVNIYVDSGLETFDDQGGWCSIEVDVARATKLRGGRRGRYCVTGSSGDMATEVAAVALWVRRVELPLMMRV